MVTRRLKVVLNGKTSNFLTTLTVSGKFTDSCYRPAKINVQDSVDRDQLFEVVCCGPSQSMSWLIRCIFLLV